MSKVILDGNKLYEIDEECMKEKSRKRTEINKNAITKDKKKNRQDKK